MERGRQIIVGLSCALVVSLVATAVLGCRDTAPKNEASDAPDDVHVARVPAPRPSEGPTAPEDGFHQGIEVRGEWTIEVRDPEGTVVDRHEFHNALHDLGGTTLVNLASGNASMGRWRVDLNPSGAGICGPLGSPTSCSIAEVASPLPATASFFKNLTVGNVGGVVLNGFATASNSGDIGEVDTYTHTCASTLSPDACRSDTDIESTIFSSRDLAAPINVSVGQTVVVTVQFTFTAESQ